VAGVVGEQQTVAGEVSGALGGLEEGWAVEEQEAEDGQVKREREREPSREAIASAWKSAEEMRLNPGGVGRAGCRAESHCVPLLNSIERCARGNVVAGVTRSDRMFVVATMQHFSRGPRS